MRADKYRLAEKEKEIGAFTRAQLEARYAAAPPPADVLYFDDEIDDWRPFAPLFKTWHKPPIDDPFRPPAGAYVPPVLVELCRRLAWGTAIGGSTLALVLLLIAGSFAKREHLAIAGLWALGISIVLAVLFASLGRIMDLLARIEFNTRKR